MSDALHQALKAVLACGERLASVPEQSPWDDDTRETVARALLDRSLGAQSINAAIDQGRSLWRDQDTFRAWLERLPTLVDTKPTST